jgi:Flp pilus assembly protein TadG
MNQLRNERGQAAVLSVVFLVALLGAMAMVLDVGSWFREKRANQAAADAAALAAAQELPGNTGAATAIGNSYVSKNGGGNITFTYSSKNVAGDTVAVTLNRDAPSYFAKLFGIDSVKVNARATARAVGLDEAIGVAPIVVNVKHPMLNCSVLDGKPVPCFGTQTRLDLINLKEDASRDAAGSFGLINLDRSNGGNVGASVLAGWVAKGFNQYMSIGLYDAAPSANFNNSQFLDALIGKMPEVLLFPIYRSIIGPGSNAQYDIVGWVGFRVSSFDPNGSKSYVQGSFVSVVWDGVRSSSGSNMNYGVRAIQLVE